MSGPDVQVFSNTAALNRAAADAIAVRLLEALARSPRASLVLTGGNTPAPVYELLSASPLAQEVPWDRVDFFWGDERAVPPDDPASNFGMAKRTLLDRIGGSPDRIHRTEGELAPDVAARRYEAELRRVLSGEEVPRFALVLLSMGDDGHTASLFPGAAWDDARLVDATFVPKLGTNRVTMTPRLLERARNTIFLVSGAGKAPALARVLEDPASNLPAGRAAPVDGTLVWMVDEPAASLLTHR